MFNIVKQTSTTSSNCSNILADGENVQFADVTEDIGEGWKDFDWAKAGFSRAKQGKSSKILVHQILNTGHMLNHFNVTGEAVYEADLPRTAHIELGQCWKKVKEFGKSSFVWNGQKFKVENKIIYILKPE